MNTESAHIEIFFSEESECRQYRERHNALGTLMFFGDEYPSIRIVASVFEETIAGCDSDRRPDHSQDASGFAILFAPLQESEYFHRSIFQQTDKKNNPLLFCAFVLQCCYV